MGKQLRPHLLKLIVVMLGDIPPFPPPGPFLPSIFRRAICPNCGKKATARPGGEFYCSRCGEYFTPKSKGLRSNPQRKDRT
jgi:hypothetical protein